MMLYYILLPFAWLLWHLGFRIRVEGRENLKKVQTQGYILAPTHVSAIDPVFIAVTRWGGRMVIFAKKELFEINAFLSWFFRCCGGVCVRGTKDEVAVISIFLSFLLIDLYPILGSSHPFLMYLLNSTEKEKSLQEQALKKSITIKN